MAHTRQSRPDSDPGCTAQVLKLFLSFSLVTLKRCIGHAGGAFSKDVTGAYGTHESGPDSGLGTQTKVLTAS